MKKSYNIALVFSLTYTHAQTCTHTHTIKIILLPAKGEKS